MGIRSAVVAKEEELVRGFLEGETSDSPALAKRLLDVLDSDPGQQIDLSFNITTLRIDRSKMQVTVQYDLGLPTETDFTIPLADFRKALLLEIK